MGKMIGKPLTRNHRKLLESNGVKDTTDWRYVKQETVTADGRITKTGQKTIYLVFQNTATGEEVKLALE